MTSPSSRAPYWTEADQAELDVLVRALADVAFLHRERCPACAAERQRSGRPCEAVVGAIEAVVGWRDRRRERSRALWLAEREYERLAELRARARALLEEEAA